LAILATVALVAFGTAEAAGPAAAPSSLRIISDRPLPPALHEASDIRWASDTSVYLSLYREGAVEASVDLDHPRVVKVIPGMREVGGTFCSGLAASPEYLVTHGPLWITWRSVSEPTRKEEAFDSIHDLDVFQDRLLIIAARRDDKGRFAPEGALAWLGSLRKGLSDLRPVAYDASGPGGKTLGACSTFEMGGARFLADGSFLVVPGVQPGIHLYSAEGRLLRTWDSGAVGIDADCASLTEQQIRRFATQFVPRVEWLNQRRTLDEILPLPQGPGLVVRSVLEGKVRWSLKILRQDGTVSTYTIPVSGQNEFAHLKGDVRSRKIVFIVSASEKDGMSSAVSRLVLAETPK